MPPGGTVGYPFRGLDESSGIATAIRVADLLRRCKVVSEDEQMTHYAREARILCTTDELSLYGDSLGWRLERLSPRDLQTRLRRARILRDKYRDVHRRQQGGARGKMTHGHPKELHDFSRTRQKAELFAEALERFERRLRALEEQDRRRTEESRLKAPGERRRADRASRRLKAERAERERHLARPTADAGPRPPFGAPPPRPGRAIQNVSAMSSAAHFRSANRRFQARHDTRR